MGKQVLVSTLRELLRDGMIARYEGGLHADKLQRQAYADGFARALREAGVLGEDELRAVVAEERATLFAEEPLAATG